MTYTDVGIVLGREVWREQDKRVSLFTAEHGRVDAVAVGALRPASKLGPHLEPLKVIDVMVADGKQFAKLAQAQTRETLWNGEIEYVRLCLAGELIALVRGATVQGVPDRALFDSLYTSLHAVYKATDPVMAAGLGLFRLAEILGYAPVVDGCVRCGAGNDLDHFSPSAGGALCAPCFLTDPGDGLGFASGGASFLQAMRAFLVWRGLL